MKHIPRIRCRAIVILMVALAQVIATSDVSAEARAASAERRAQSACAEPGDPVTLTSVEQVSALAVGTWIRCEGPPQFGQVGGGEVGIEVDVDGRFYRLFEAVDGTLIRADGLDQEGEWTVIDTTSVNGPGSYQIDWSILGGGTLSTLPAFLDAPSSLRLDANPGSARYELWTGAPPVSGPPPDAGSGGCGHPTGPITPSAVGQVQDLLVGAWTRCGDTSVLGDPAGEVGIEFTADARFHRLVRDADGTTIRAVGDGQEGTWTVLDTTSANGPGSFQLNLQVMGGSVPTFPLFFGTPPFVRFVGTTGLPSADYLRGEPLGITEPVTPAPSELPVTGSGTSAPLLIVAVLVILLGVLLRTSSRQRLRRPGSRDLRPWSLQDASPSFKGVDRHRRVHRSRG